MKKKYLLVTWTIRGLDEIEDITDLVPPNIAMTQAQYELDGREHLIAKLRAKYVHRINKIRWKAGANPYQKYQAYVVPLDFGANIKTVRSWAVSNFEMFCKHVEQQGINLLNGDSVYNITNFTDEYEK